MRRDVDVELLRRTAVGQVGALATVKGPLRTRVLSRPDVGREGRTQAADRLGGWSRGTH